MMTAQATLYGAAPSEGFASPVWPSVATEIKTLQIGNDWLEERPGGLNRFYSELLKHLPEAHVQVRGLVVGNEHIERNTNGMMTGFASPNAHLAVRLLRGRQAGLRILREDKPDLIASHFALYAMPLLDQLRTFPTVIHFHGPWAAEAGVEGQSSLGSKTQAAVERAVYARGRRVIVLSRAFGRELTRRYRVPDERIRIIPGGVDSERFNDRLTRTEARDRLGWPTDRPVVLSVRRHVRRMGLETLIDAARLVRSQVPDVLFLFAGSGPISGDLRRRIAEHNLEENVRLLGRLDDTNLAVAYRAADLSVVPSQALEGFGMITLESLSCGTPVMVTPVGGLPEVVAPFAPECVFEGTTADIIADALNEVLRGRRVLPNCKVCRGYAVAGFSWPIIAERTRQVYEEVLQ
jgi:glycosyltransferase involved in cell wall biosynthesis